MTKPTLLLLLLIFRFGLINSQYATNEEKILEVDEYIQSKDFKEALILLEDLRKNNIQNSNIDFKTGFCYLNVAVKSRALPLLKQASENISKTYDPENPLEENAPVETMLFLGDAYRNSNNFGEAIGCYRKYSALAGDSTANEVSQKRIRECHIARLLQNSPIEVKWNLLNTKINQGISNLNPVVSADGTTLAFTRKMKFYDAVFISHSKGGVWQEPENITTQIGSDGDFYPTALSSDGKRLLLCSSNVLDGQEIYESTWNGNRWTKSKKLDDGVNSEYIEINASYSPDDKTIFFASNRGNGYGGFDIYRSIRRADDSWSHAINLGSTVNTKFDEKTPRLLDGNILTFSSQGHLGMGGFDFFYTNYPIESVSKVKNIGFPINTVNDDISFSPLWNQKIGFIAKHNRNSVVETDIFEAAYTSFSNFFEIPVKLEITDLPKSDLASVFLVDAVINDTIGNITSEINNGTVDYILYPGIFILIAETSSGKSEKVTFNVPDNVKSNFFPVALSMHKKEPAMDKHIITADTLISENIIFEINRYSLKSNYQPMLDKLAKQMLKYPNMRLTITGYTDILGDEAYNKNLSIKRAGEVRFYLKKKGVDSKRIKVSGAGKAAFIAPNTNPDGSDNPEGRRYNRRVEINFENIPEGLVIEKRVTEKLR